MSDLIKQWIRSALSGSKNVFESVLDQFRIYLDKPVGSITEFKRRTTKNKGDLFEHFSLLYLQALGIYQNVWLLKDIPESILTELHLTRADRGIDLVASDRTGYIAIQCKLRLTPSRNKYGQRQHVVTWKELGLSSFIAYVLKLDLGLSNS